MPTLEISRIDSETLLVPIVGTSPLIVHRFSEKAKRRMLDGMQGRSEPKQPKDPDAEYEAAFYRLKLDENKGSKYKQKTGGEIAYGIPVIAFKSATVGAARFYGKNVKMTELRQFVFMRGVIGEDNQALAVIDGEPRMREDVVHVGSGTDLRYRPEFWPWSTTLEVVYVKSALQRSSLLSLIDAGGLGVGVGEWRTEKRGDFGGYRVDPDREVEVLG